MFKEKEKESATNIFDNCSKLKWLAFLDQSLSHVYDDLAYDEDSTFIAYNQHNIVGY